MNEQRLLNRIACDPRVVVGKPVIKGTRLTVEFVLNLLAHDSTIQEILDEYDGLTREDIQACLLFASQSLGSTTFMPLAETA
jgi:uncharacterized protein (DUF433 family)